MRFFYNTLYRYSRAPWDIGVRRELVELVESGRTKPCRAIDLGSGTASNAIYLAQHGFDVTGVDFAPAAIEMGRRMARETGVRAEFVVDDLTNLRHVRGPFDLLVDYGTLDDLTPPDRDQYLRNVLPLTAPRKPVLAVLLRVGAALVGAPIVQDQLLRRNAARSGGGRTPLRPVLRRRGAGAAR